MGFVYNTVVLHGLNSDYFRLKIEHDYYEHFILKATICVYKCIVCDCASTQVSLKCNATILMLAAEENSKIYDTNTKGKKYFKIVF